MCVCMVARVCVGFVRVCADCVLRRGVLFSSSVRFASGTAVDNSQSDHANAMETHVVFYMRRRIDTHTHTSTHPRCREVV